MSETNRLNNNFQKEQRKNVDLHNKIDKIRAETDQKIEDTVKVGVYL